MRYSDDDSHNDSIIKSTKISRVDIAAEWLTEHKIIKDAVIVEGVENAAYHILDRAGVDLAGINPFSGQPVSVAVRTQVVPLGRRPHNSFTLRAEKEGSGMPAELVKRQAAIENGLVFPDYTLHQYLAHDRKTLLTLGCIPTDQLLLADKAGWYEERTNSAEEGYEVVYRIYQWRVLKANGLPVYVYEV